ncbi:MAG TPA: peptide MFS transporter, partial [Acidobacteriota bacterium]
MPADINRSGFAGHPSGLVTLFFTELWERFSYYGMRAILVLYMVTVPTAGGLGFDTKHASSIYGTYTMCVWLATVPGGFIADRWLGARFSVLIGGIVIACGHYCMVLADLPFFYAGLALIASGTGLLKPNISTLVGSLYEANDPRRDSGFSLFYMGINVGAMLAPLVCGYLAQSDSFKALLTSWGFDPTYAWHWGFGAAGVGMTLGLIVFLAQRRRIGHIGDRLIVKPPGKSSSEHTSALTGKEWKRVLAIFIFFLFTIFFWAAYEQKGASLNLFALKLVRTEVFGWKFPSSWLQSLTAFFVILLAPIFSMIWVRMGDRQPSSPAKFTLGLFFITLAYALLIPACAMTA